MHARQFTLSGRLPKQRRRSFATNSHSGCFYRVLFATDFLRKRSRRLRLPESPTQGEDLP